MKKFNCPVCNKELVRLEPFENGVYEFWCDDCDIDIVITKNNETNKGFFTVVGYDKDNDVYVEYGTYDLSVEAEYHGKQLKELINKGELRRENGEPIDWIEVVQSDNYDVVYWVSYAEDEYGNRIVD